MRKTLISALTVTSLTLTACTNFLERIPGVYAIDIQQGNIFDQETVDQLRPNMNKKQVLYIMGSPMLRDVFHQKRWDYIYSEQPGGEARVQKRLSIYFEGDSLVGVQGDFRPSSVPVIRASNEVTVDVPVRVLDNKTMSEKVVDLFTFGDSDAPVLPEDEITGDLDSNLETEATSPETATSESETESMETQPMLDSSPENAEQAPKTDEDNPDAL